MRYSLDDPHPDHTPSVRRVFLGTTPLGGRRYGTTLRCSCGHRGRVANEPPSKGGRRAAWRAYRGHLIELNLMDPRMNPQVLPTEGWTVT